MSCHPPPSLHSSQKGENHVHLPSKFYNRFGGGKELLSQTIPNQKNIHIEVFQFFSDDLYIITVRNRIQFCERHGWSFRDQHSVLVDISTAVTLDCRLQRRFCDCRSVSGRHILTPVSARPLFEPREKMPRTAAGSPTKPLFSENSLCVVAGGFGEHRTPELS